MDLELPAFGSYGIKRKKAQDVRREDGLCVLGPTRGLTSWEPLDCCYNHGRREHTQKCFEAEESEERVCSVDWC